VPVSSEIIHRIADVLKAMADPTRLKILYSLHDNELCVTSILENVGGSQANVSKHLSVLRRTGLVDCRRDGLKVFYRIIDDGAISICKQVCDSLESRLDRERQLLIDGRRDIDNTSAGKSEPGGFTEDQHADL